MTKIIEVDLYCRIKNRVIGVGMVGPKIPVKVRKHLADLLMEKSSDWSLTPFEIKEEEMKNA